MSQTGHDLEGGNPSMCYLSLWTCPTDFINVYSGVTRMATARSVTVVVTPDQPLRSSEEESDYSNSSWPLYSIYSNIAEDEDNKMVERCQEMKMGP